MSDCIFVYGTLMHGFEHPMAAKLSSEADYLGKAWCAGRLYRVAHYPGLLHATSPEDVVHGDLFRMRDAATLLAVLDDYEGIGPNEPQPTLYLRELLPVTMADDSVTSAWTYVYNRPVEDAARILSGRFAAG